MTDVKDYNPIWRDNPGGFGPANPQMIGYCVSYSRKPKKEDITIIDVASGNGRYAIPFAQMGYGHVTALDVSEVGCELIKSRVADSPNFSVIHGDVLEYKTANTFDIVFSCGLLEEFSCTAAQVSAVKKMQDLTAPEGLLVMRYCLSISNRNPEQRVAENLVRPLFSEREWEVMVYTTDPAAITDSKSTIKGEPDRIRRQTIVARRRKSFPSACAA